MISTPALSAPWGELSEMASMPLLATSLLPLSTGMNAISTFLDTRDQAVGCPVVVQSVAPQKLQHLIFISAFPSDPEPRKSIAEIPAEWHDKEYRAFYAEAAAEQDIAWQIKANRQHRKMSQADLARLLGTQQSAVSRLEDPEYGQHSIETLKKVAAIFDCALQVKLVSFGKLHEESADLSMGSMLVPSFSEEFCLSAEAQE